MLASMTPFQMGVCALGAVLGPLVLLAVTLRELVEVTRAAIDLHLRTQVAIHKELCRLNDRFQAREAPPMPSAPPPDVQARIDALRRAS